MGIMDEMANRIVMAIGKCKLTIPNCVRVAGELTRNSARTQSLTDFPSFFTPSFTYYPETQNFESFKKKKKKKKMGSELIFRGHESQPVSDTYTPKQPKPWFSVTQPIRYMLREQRLVFVLVGIAIATIVFTLLPPSSTSRVEYGHFTIPETTTRLSQYDQKPMYEHRSAFHMYSSGKVPLGLKRKGLRIVVTGGAGFVGSHLVDRLMERGDSVIVVDNFFTGRKENVMHHFGNPRFELIRHDVVEPLLLEVDQIYHLACPASPVHYKFNPVKTIISFL
nr:udp-glucuronic acid decarboxylase 2 [Quercus suber]